MTRRNPRFHLDLVQVRTAIIPQQRLSTVILLICSMHCHKPRSLLLLHQGLQRPAEQHFRLRSPHLAIQLKILYVRIAIATNHLLARKVESGTKGLNTAKSKSPVSGVFAPRPAPTLVLMSATTRRSKIPERIK